MANNTGKATKDSKKLTKKEQVFVDFYIVELNGTQAALKSGYGKDEKSASVYASRLLAKTKIMVAIQVAMDQRKKRTQIDADFTVKRLAWMSDSNIKKVAKWGEREITSWEKRGTAKDAEWVEIKKKQSYLEVIPSEEIPDEVAYGIESVTLKPTEFGPMISVKMRSPNSALELLARHQGLLELAPTGDKKDDVLDAALAELDKERDARTGVPQEERPPSDQKKPADPDPEPSTS